MAWLRWVIVALVVVDAGYMTVDGTRALIAGDFFTPTSGEHAGELGPWASLVEATGLDPRSTPMKIFFIVYGVTWLVAVAAFALSHSWAWWAVLVLAAGSVWYLTIGTIVSVVVIAALVVPAVRDLYSS